MRARLLGDRTRDTGCGLKILRRELYLDLPYFDHNHRFLPALVMRQGGKTVSVEVNHRPRERGQSNYGVFDRLWVGIADLLGVMWLMRRGSRPELVAEEEEQPVARRTATPRAMRVLALAGRVLVLLLIAGGHRRGVAPSRRVRSAGHFRDGRGAIRRRRLSSSPSMWRRACSSSRAPSWRWRRD